MKTFFQSSGVTGGIFERETLGECKARAIGYLKFQEAMTVVRRNQPCDVRHPKGETAVFHTAVAQALGVAVGELEVYTAVGSALDLYHGIDGFFVWRGIAVTVDLTLNPHKDEHKARVIVTGADAEQGYATAAAKIAGHFRRVWSARAEGRI